jgi:hypothetical protein
MAITYESAEELARALERAAAAHHDYEQQTGKPDEEWAAWYAEHMARERAGYSDAD